MPTRQVVKTDKAPPPLPVYSQAIICNGMVYCSGQVAMHPETKAMVEGGIADRTVRSSSFLSLDFDVGLERWERWPADAMLGAMFEESVRCAGSSWIELAECGAGRRVFD